MTVDFKVEVPTELFTPWDNFWQYIIILVVGNLIVFLCSWVLHYLKAKNAKPYKGPQKLMN